MSIRGIVRKSEAELDLESEPLSPSTIIRNIKIVYSANIGFGSSKGGLMRKKGNEFVDPCPEDIEKLEYFVSKGLAEKTIVES